MKILNNFDTELEKHTVWKYIEMYWEENILVIHRSKTFRLFTVFFPFLLWIGSLTWAIIFWLWDFQDVTWSNIAWVIALIVFLWVFVMWGSILKQYLDYKMDFCIVTPNEVAMYNQSWIFKRNSRVIDADKIKTVSVDTSWIIKSIFNFWNLIFLSEGDPSMWTGDISLNYVHAANDTKNKVRELIEPHLQRNNIDISIDKEESQ